MEKGKGKGSNPHHLGSGDAPPAKQKKRNKKGKGEKGSLFEQEEQQKSFVEPPQEESQQSQTRHKTSKKKGRSKGSQPKEPETPQGEQQPRGWAQPGQQPGPSQQQQPRGWAQPGQEQPGPSQQQPQPPRGWAQTSQPVPSQQQQPRGWAQPEQEQPGAPQQQQPRGWAQPGQEQPGPPQQQQPRGWAQPGQEQPGPPQQQQPRGWAQPGQEQRGPSQQQPPRGWAQPGQQPGPSQQQPPRGWAQPGQQPGPSQQQQPRGWAQPGQQPGPSQQQQPRGWPQPGQQPGPFQQQQPRGWAQPGQQPGSSQQQQPRGWAQPGQEQPGPSQQQQQRGWAQPGQEQPGPSQQQQPRGWAQPGQEQPGPSQQQQPRGWAQPGQEQPGPSQQQQPRGWAQPGQEQPGPSQQQQPRGWAQPGQEQPGPSQQQQPRGWPQPEQEQPGPSQQRQPRERSQTRQDKSGPSPHHSRGSSPSRKHRGQSQSPRGQRKEPSTRGEKSYEIVRSIEFAERINAPVKSGRQIQVAANFFSLIIKNPKIVVHHYDVEIEPDKPKFLMREVWNKYVSLVFPGRKTAFDGKNAYSKGPLEIGETVVTKVIVHNQESKKEKEFNVRIKEVRTIKFSCFHNYRARMLKDRSLKVIPEAEMAVLDIIIQNYACDNYVRAGRTFFPPSATKPLTRNLSDKLSLRIGYFQAAFLGYKPYLNFDISHKAFYQECSVMDILECFRHRKSNALNVDEMNHFVRNVKVEYQLPNDSSSYRIFRVNKLVDNANSQKFKKEDGSSITVADYFAREKKCKLRYPELPLLWVGPTQRTIYLPMEFCRIVQDQVYKGLMDSFETREMVKHATSNAKDRQRDVYHLFAKNKLNEHPLMKEFELSVSNDMERVAARVLDAPELRTSRNIRVREGVWRIQDFLEPVTLNKWCILNLDHRVSKQSVMNLQKMIKDKGNDFHMRIGDPARSPIDGDSRSPALKKALSQLKGMEMVFVIISEEKGIYSKVKSICETQEGILTQCIKSRTVSQDPRKFSTTVENILLKVNAKLGGKNHCLDRSSIPSCLKGNVMVVGADVTHPSPGMKIPSVAAVTVSCDPAAFQYGTTTRVQPKGEMIVDLEEIIGIHLKRFYQVRKAYPEKIIFFRDGVSEGEMEKVLKGELAAVKKACNPYCKPKITFVTVQKRHHTRLYPVSDSDAQGRNFNVPVGTCVDSDIVHPRELDFYLVSHASILGTARPTRYRLLHDDNKLTDDELEKLSFYLCHLFSRCNRSVSYPSPTYNAHLAAARVRAYLEGLNLMGTQDIVDIQKKIPDRISNISPMFFV